VGALAASAVIRYQVAGMADSDCLQGSRLRRLTSAKPSSHPDVGPGSH